jgi:UDP-glucose 4-epimerase
MFQRACEDDRALLSCVKERSSWIIDAFGGRILRVLVTGGAGYIGSIVTRALLERGHQVTVFDDLSTGFRANVPASVQLIEGDIRDATHVHKIFEQLKPDTVVHLAGKLVVQESIRDPLNYYSVNVQGGLNVLSACQHFGTKQFVFSSTAAVYGDSPQMPVTELAPVQPLSPYGHSKAMFEKILSDFGAAGKLSYVILRYFNVAGAAKDLSVGPRQKDTTNLVRIVAQCAAGARASVEVFGTDYATPDGSAIRDFIHVEDLASAHTAAVDYLAAGGASETLNCGYGRGVSVLELIASFKQIAMQKFAVITTNRRDGDIAESIANNQRLCKVLNWRPEHDSLTSLCQSAMDWERTQVKSP